MSFHIREAIGTEVVIAHELSRLAFAELRNIYIPKTGVLPSSPSADRSVLVAVTGDKLVGTVQYAFADDRVHLSGLAVATDWRHQGVARSLIHSLNEIAASRKMRALSLYTIRETGNVTIFERLGFSVIREEAATWALRPTGAADLTDVYMKLDVDRHSAG